MAYDIVALGELLVDFTEYGRSPGGSRLFEQNPGGAPANVLAAAARCGCSTALISKVGADLHGRFLIDALAQAGVDVSGVSVTPDAFTTLAFVALSDQGERTFSFARRHSADTQLRPEDIPAGLSEQAAIFHVGSLSLTEEPARSATWQAVSRAKAAGALISYDPNYRAALWPSEAAAAEQMRALLPCADLVKLSQEETALLTGYSDPERAARALTDSGVGCAAVTLGAAGALVCANGQTGTVPGFSVPVVDTTGAGDAFWGGFLYLVRKFSKPLDRFTLEDLSTCALWGNAAAALCVGRRGGIPAMPSADEILAFLSGAQGT